jgi:hypothetical protein
VEAEEETVALPRGAEGRRRTALTPRPAAAGMETDMEMRLTTDELLDAVDLWVRTNHPTLRTTDGSTKWLDADDAGGPDLIVEVEAVVKPTEAESV